MHSPTLFAVPHLRRFLTPGLHTKARIAPGPRPGGRRDRRRQPHSPASPSAPAPQTASATPPTGAGIVLNAPIVGVASTPSGNGYWEESSDGGIFTFGGAGFYGSTGGLQLNRPIVGMAPTPDGRGYWEVASDGGVFSFGDAQFHGSTGAISLNQPIVGIDATPDGGGYWMVAADGGVFSFGDAPFYGSASGLSPDSAIVGIASTPDGQGYWEVAADGAVFAFGDAGYAGGAPASQSVVAISATGNGYRLATASGAVYAYGGAGFYGSINGLSLNRPIIGIGLVRTRLRGRRLRRRHLRLRWRGVLRLAGREHGSQPVGVEQRRVGRRCHQLPASRLGQGQHLRGGRRVERQRAHLQRRARVQPCQLEPVQHLRVSRQRRLCHSRGADPGGGHLRHRLLGESQRGAGPARVQWWLLTRRPPSGRQHRRSRAGQRRGTTRSDQRRLRPTPASVPVTMVVVGACCSRRAHGVHRTGRLGRAPDPERLGLPLDRSC